MTDITKIAQACASRIMDRMEMCRGSAILKSDIENEVKTALREHFDVLWPKYDDEIEGLVALEGEGCTVISEATVKGRDVIADPAHPWSDSEAPAITVEEAQKRGIPIGSPGYVWIA